jgi:chemotaxis family two-component system sensor kinase Cph1
MVNSYLQLLSKRYSDELDEDAKEFIHYAVDGAERMQALIEDLLIYSRLNTQAKEFELTDVNDCLNVALENIRIQIEESGAKIGHDKLPVLKVDGSQIVQVFQNLISNAIKFVKDKKPEVYISAEECGDNWVFSIQDNGIGIDPEFKERIFSMGQRLHPVGQFKGSGIGLAICRKVIERHGGSIWVESALGSGANFIFTIPVKGGDKK